jgi:branched-chain amino acid transport system ATP-binding protein
MATDHPSSPSLATIASGTVDGDSSRPVLRATELVKRYGGVVAVDGLSLALDPGEILGVMGPNGAGKSTLLKLLAGIVRPTSGEVVLADRRIDRLRTFQVARSGIALAHQIPRPFPELTVAQNVAVSQPGSKAAGPRRSVGEILELVRLAPKARRAASSLGLLDLKRLELGRALALAPRVLLLDEVGAGLARPELKTLVELVAEINADGTAIVIVEHVQELLRELAHRVVVIDWGKVVAEGTPAEVSADREVQAIYLGRSAAASSVSTPPQQRRGRPDGAPVLALESVTARYGRLVALRDVDLEVRQGEILAVLGANGAGKSTLSRVISGLIRPSSGRLLLGGEDVTGRAAHRIADLGVGHCQEGRHVFGDLTVRENLLLGSYLRRAREGERERLHEIETLFPALAERAKQRAGSLSGGQQQMLAIGRALMSDPSVVVFDEVSLGLAPKVIDEIYDALEQVNARGVTLLIIEQSVHRALAIADQAVVLQRGEVSFAGSPRALEHDDALQRAYFGHVTPASGP